MAITALWLLFISNVALKINAHSAKLQMKSKKSNKLRISDNTSLGFAANIIGDATRFTTAPEPTNALKAWANRADLLCTSNIPKINNADTSISSIACCVA